MNWLKKIFTFFKNFFLSMLEPVFGHTRIVIFVKKLLIFVSVILIFILVITPIIIDGKKDASIEYDELDISSSNNPRMVNPKLKGFDSKGQKYNISADIAEQISQYQVKLNNIEADLSLRSGKWISLLSTYGIYYFKEEILKLEDNINLFSDGDYELHSTSMLIDLKNNTAFGDENIEIQSSLGYLKAKGFKITNEGDRFLFSNPFVVIYPEGIKK